MNVNVSRQLLIFQLHNIIAYTPLSLLFTHFFFTQKSKLSRKIFLHTKDANKKLRFFKFFEFFLSFSDQAHGLVYELSEILSRRL